MNMYTRVFMRDLRNDPENSRVLTLIDFVSHTVTGGAAFCNSPFFEGEVVFFFNGTAATEIYNLSLHDALPIYRRSRHRAQPAQGRIDREQRAANPRARR